MNKIFSFVLLAFTYVNSVPAFGSDMQNEIDYLLKFVENAECQYERNGKIHSGKDTVEHIKKKYSYFKNEVDSTEKFIELSATKSMMSGKYYMVHCKGGPALKTQDWLLQELESYRSKNSNTTFNFDLGR